MPSILLWHLDDTTDPIRVTRDMLVDAPRGEVSAMAFDASGALVALAYQNEVEVLHVQTHQLFVTLEGHLRKVLVYRSPSYVIFIYISCVLRPTYDE